jgi:hypothetical protein
MSDTVKIRKLTGAQLVEGYDFCLWGNPKLSVICGHCSGPFKTREYIFMADRGGQIAVFCPHCQYYNLTGLYP